MADVDDYDGPDALDDEPTAGEVHLPLGDVDALPPAFSTFVESTLLDSLTGASKGRWSWCTQWRRHPDAVHRLFAIWQQWLDVQADPMMLHDFLRNTLDYHLPLLVGEHGSLHGCQYGHREHARIAIETKGTT